MKHSLALTIARDIQAQLAPACVQIEIAGGLRRGKPDVHDIVAVNPGHALTPLLPGQTISVPACRPARPRWPSGPIGPRTRVTSR